MTTIETKTLYEGGPVQIVGQMHTDSDARPDDQDFDSPEKRADYLKRFAADDFMFVGMAVAVIVDGKEVGYDSLWGIEHGYVADDVYANAWENTPAEYPQPNHVVMGSPLNGVINEAVDEAIKWLKNRNAEVPPELYAAQQWADPNWKVKR
jgi:hypothetical protein